MLPILHGACLVDDVAVRVVALQDGNGDPLAVFHACISNAEHPVQVGKGDGKN